MISKGDSVDRAARMDRMLVASVDYESSTIEFHTTHRQVVYVHTVCQAVKSAQIRRL